MGLMSYFVFYARAQGTQRSGAKYFLGREEASLLISVPADSHAVYIHRDDFSSPSGNRTTLSKELENGSCFLMNQLLMSDLVSHTESYDAREMVRRYRS